MKTNDNKSTKAVQLFEPGPDEVYDIDAAGRIAQVPRRAILIYYKLGLVSAVADPEYGGYYFDDNAIRTIRRIEYLRIGCGMNLAGIKLVMSLMTEVEQLREESRFLRH